MHFKIQGNDFRSSLAQSLFGEVVVMWFRAKTSFMSMCFVWDDLKGPQPCGQLWVWKAEAGGTCVSGSPQSEFKVLSQGQTVLIILTARTDFLFRDIPSCGGGGTCDHDTVFTSCEPHKPLSQRL